jgi:hypothetical protein
MRDQLKAGPFWFFRWFWLFLLPEGTETEGGVDEEGDDDNDDDDEEEEEDPEAEGRRVSPSPSVGPRVARGGEGRGNRRVREGRVRDVDGLYGPVERGKRESSEEITIIGLTKKSGRNG